MQLENTPSRCCLCANGYVSGEVTGSDHETGDSIEQIRVRRGLVLGQLPAVVVVQDAGFLLTSLNEYSQQHIPAVYYCLTLRFITKHTLCA